MHARRCSGQLYNALEVPPNASEADIRKAYHRKAMIYHPDKAGDAFRVQFQEIQEADEILRDPQRRRMYDIFGRAGMRAIEGGIGAEYADLLVSNLHRIRWIFLILAYFFLMCFAELVILIRQVDGEAGYNWFVVFIPIWIMDLILGGGALYFLFIMLRHPSKIPLYFVMFGNMASFACGTVFVALALNGTVTWHLAFIPLLSLTGLYFYSELRQAGLGTYRETLRQAGDPEAETVTCGSEGYMAYVVTIVWRVTCICAFSILLWMRVTQAATFSYYVVFLPIFLWMWLPLIWRLYVICFTSRIVKHISDKAIMSFMLIFSYLNSFLTIGLLAVKCHQAEVGAEQLSLVYVLIPPMVVTVLLSMAFCAIALVLPADMMQLGAADTYNSTLATASASEPLMQAQRANATANQFTYAHHAAERGDISGATKAATDGVKMAYGATS